MLQLCLKDETCIQYVIIQEQILYIGKTNIELGEYEPVNPKVLESLYSIPLAYIKVIQLGTQHPNITIEYSKNSTFDFELRDSTIRQEFQNKIVELFPKSKIEHKQASDIALIKKPLIAMAVIVLIYFMLLRSDKFPHHLDINQKIYLTDVLQAIASIGIVNYTLLFSAFLLIAIVALIRKMNPRNGKIWIKIRR